MKALTIWQPWASLIMIGAKPYEFRSWKPPLSLIGQRLAIHAGARPVRASEVRALVMALKGNPNMANPCLKADIALPMLDRVLLALSKSPDTLWGTSEQLTLPISHVLGTVVVGEPKRGDECAAEFGEAAGNDSDREGTFNWGWPMLDIKHEEPPRQAKGAQGLWDWR
ncbi:ASCH domain-containing protein [Aminobacter sp. MDW-2]|uniref:ASCH domain-containing protein n=1 Tax=Aminobacter sp. MDW-2 TaxID=2666139 RepID=UPI0012AF42BE|nr:ASCH domain-containing protein [Aminobacter sp. MDW-2]MRX32784.1 ASCH domain-containing protein [Aminobacter sp. MDW-2]QNH34554.1 ASCH domain-containing protein [Aminobacter sp. MDW-2]